MSQRLYIGKTDDCVYDCVISDTHKVREKLMTDWLRMKFIGDGFLMPWKIYIHNIELYEYVQPIIAQLLFEIGRTFPDAIWCFYYKDKNIEHPNPDELKRFLND